MTTGRFIALEGGEGAGKSTQARMLVDALRRQGIDVVSTREPGGTPGAEAIRELLLSNEGEGFGPRAEALLFAAARADHVERLIKPALAAGRWVVCDRFVDSSRAYQGGGNGVTDADVLALHRLGSEGTLPDVTVLVEVSPAVAAERLALRDAGRSDRIGGRSAEYHARVGQAFSMFAEREPDRFVRVDGNGSADVTHAAIMAALAGVMPGVTDTPA